MAAPTVSISGLGGLFFRSSQPDVLAKWYETHFGITAVGDNRPPWSQEAGLTVFAPFAADTQYFGRAEQQFMVNFRVANLDDALAKLEAANVRIDEQRMNESYGKFAWVYDPDGNKIELWQPIGEVPAEAFQSS